MTDEQGWIEAARQGKAEAWESLVQAHEQAVFRLAYLLLGDADDAQDAAQEAFLRAYRALSRFDVEKPFKPWLLAITANVCRNARRSLGRYLAALQKAFRQEAEPLSIPAAGWQAQKQMEAETLWASVRTLGLEDQKMIYLRYFLEFSEAETAGVLGVPPGTVKSRHHRALKRLRKLLAEGHPELLEEGFDAR